MFIFQFAAMILRRMFIGQDQGIDIRQTSDLRMYRIL
jgi:hypothetical protein